MKNLFTSTLSFILCFSIHLCAAEIKLTGSKNNAMSISLNGVNIDNNSTASITADGKIKFTMQNQSKLEPCLYILSASRDITIPYNVLKEKGFVETTEKQLLTYGEASLALEGNIEVFFGDQQDANNLAHAFFSIQKKPDTKPAADPGGDKAAQRQPYIPGCAVTDAIALNTDKALTKEEMLRLLSHYFPGAKTQDDIKNAAQNNPFLKSIVNDQLFANAYIPPATVSESDGKGIASALSLSGIGGLDVTSLADGFAKFIVKRTKQELSIAFFDKMKKELDSYEYRDLRSLFPQTYSLLSTIGTDIYNYQRYLENLREAYIADLDALVTNLPSIIKNHPEFFDKPENKVFAASLKSACYVAGELQNQSHPGDILANYPVSHLQDFEKEYPAASVQTLQLVNMSMRKAVSKEDEEADYWVDIKQIRNLVNDKKAFKIYLGLLYQHTLNNYKDIVYDSTKNISLLSVLKKIADKYDTTSEDYQAYKQYILQFAQKTQALNTMIKTYKGQPLNDSSAVELYAKYFTSAVDLIEYSTKASELPYIKNTEAGNLHETLQPYFEVSYKVADLATDINRKNYAAAINNAVAIYNLVKSKKEIRELEVKTTNVLSKRQAKKANKRAEKEIAKLPAEQQKAKRDEIKNTISQKRDNYSHRKINEEKLDSLTQLLQKLMQYGAFFASVAESKNSDEVANTIETFALPTGSFRVKKESAFNVSLNAYCGFYYGHEGIKPFQLKDKHVMNAYGITAPIGIAASIGIPKCSSVSVFASIVDLGAVTAFRFEDDTTTTIAKIELRDILSPGIFISWGLPKIPISLNVGYQMTPLLRTVGVSANGYAPATSRISIGLCVDIPVLNLYTKTR